MKNRIFLLLVLTLVLLVVFIILTFMTQKAPKEEFVDLRDPDYIRQLFENQIPVKTEAQLSETQRKRLYKTIVQILFFYRDGDLGKFLSYLQERGGTFNPEKLRGFRNLFAAPDEVTRKSIAKILPHFNQWPPRDNAAIFRAAWLLAYTSAGVWDAIAPKTAYIRIFQSQRPLSSEEAMKVIRAKSQQSVVFARLTNFPKEGQSPCLYAEVSFRARHPTKDPPWRYFLWLRWSDAIGNWFLDLAGMDFAGLRNNNTNLRF